MNRIARVLLAAVTLLAGCSRLGVKGDGVIKTEDRVVADFSRIEVSGAYEVQWSHGQPGLSITADENLLPYIRVAVSGDTVKIDSEENLRPSKNIVVVASSNSLAGVEASGAITFKASEISGDELKLEATGASNITVEGAATNLDANLTGASTLKAASLRTKTASLALTGASNAAVTVSDDLHVSVTGAGSVTYSGNPKSVEKTITGAGSVRPHP